jgi:flagellar motor protein MotB
VNFYNSSSEEEDEDLRNAIDEIVATDYLGADESEESSSDSSNSSGDEDESEEEAETETEIEQEKQKQEKEKQKQEKEKQKEKQKEKEKQKQKQKEKQKAKQKATEKDKIGERRPAEQEQEQEYQVGEFVTAIYEGQWLLAQVDIDQDNAGSSHVNLTYMEKVGDNQFKWPKHDDRLLTLKEDILFRSSTPVLVGSSIRASHVGLPPSEALKADAALDLVSLSSADSTFFFIFFYLFLMGKGKQRIQELMVRYRYRMVPVL